MMHNKSFLRSSRKFDFHPHEWGYIIPHTDGFLVHLSEDCAVLFKQLTANNGAVYDVVTHFKTEKAWEPRDWEARISKERTARAFREGDVTCFFDAVDLTKFQEYFATNAHTAQSVEVYLFDEAVTPEELDDDLFDRFMDLAERFGFEYCVSYAKNADVFKEISDSYRMKEARLRPLSEEQLYSVPLRRKGIVKALAQAAAGVAGSTLAAHAGQLLVKSPDWRLKVVGAIVVGVGTVATFWFGQQSAVVAKHAYTNPILTEGGGDIGYAA